MHRSTSPQDVYRRIDLDARVSGARADELVHLCYEQLIAALGTAIFAESRQNSLLKSQSLTRSLSAITALQMGIDPDSAMGKALFQVYGAARQTILNSVVTFDAATLSAIRQDMIDIQSAIRAT